MIASLIVALHLMGFIAQESAVTSLYVTAALLFVAEIGVVSFGLIAFNGLIALYAGFAIQTGHDLFFGVKFGWSTLFGIAFVEFAVIGAVIFLYAWLRGQKTVTGKDSMIGEKATVIEWDGKSGNVSFEGEIWKAKSKSALDLDKDDEVVVDAVRKLDLIITA